MRRQLSTYVLSLALLLCTQAAAHMEMKWPYPLRSRFNPNNTYMNIDYSMTSPLASDGSNYPCKGYHIDRPRQAVTTYTAGSTYNMSLSGSARHSGGSCQLSLSYDEGATFTVIKSIIGSCPLSDNYDFTIPADAPAGKSILLAWTWQNLSGNREFYMGCAEVDVISSPVSRHRRRQTSSFSSRPDIWKANMERVNSCTTTEGRETVYPNPGPDTSYSEGLSSSSPATPGNCDAKFSPTNETPESTTTTSATTVSTSTTESTTLATSITSSTTDLVESTTAQSSTSESITTQSSIAETSSTTDLVESTTAQSSTSESITTQSSIAETSSTTDLVESTTAQSSTSESITTQSSIAETSSTTDLAEATTVQSSTSESITTQSSIAETSSTTDLVEATTAQSSTSESIATQSSIVETSSATAEVEATTVQSSASESTTTQSSIAETSSATAEVDATSTTSSLPTAEMTTTPSSAEVESTTTQSSTYAPTDAPPCPSTSADVCAPSNNNDVCASEAGRVYDTECGIEYEGAVIDTSAFPPSRKRNFRSTFAGCQNLCDLTQCVGLNYIGTECTVFSVTTGSRPNANAISAAVLPPRPDAVTTTTSDQVTTTSEAATSSTLEPELTTTTVSVESSTISSSSDAESTSTSSLSAAEVTTTESSTIGALTTTSSVVEPSMETTSVQSSTDESSTTQSSSSTTGTLITTSSALESDFTPTLSVESTASTSGASESETTVMPSPSENETTPTLSTSEDECNPTTSASEMPTTTLSSPSENETAPAPSTSEVTSITEYPQPASTTLSTTTTSSSASSTQMNAAPTGTVEGFATGDVNAQFLPCVPGRILCTSRTTYLTCDYNDGTVSSDQTYVYSSNKQRQVAAGMECLPARSPFAGPTEQYDNTAPPSSVDYRDDREVRWRPEGACSRNGELRCTNGGQTFSICDHGGWIPMGSVAPGTVCQDGNFIASS